MKHTDIHVLQLCECLRTYANTIREEEYSDTCGETAEGKASHDQDCARHHHPTSAEATRQGIRQGAWGTQTV